MYVEVLNLKPNVLACLCFQLFSNVTSTSSRGFSLSLMVNKKKIKFKSLQDKNRKCRILTGPCQEHLNFLDDWTFSEIMFFSVTKRPTKFTPFQGKQFHTALSGLLEVTWGSSDRSRTYKCSFADPFRARQSSFSKMALLGLADFKFLFLIFFSFITFPIFYPPFSKYNISFNTSETKSCQS